jgi:nucleoside-triphosphatase
LHRLLARLPAKRTRRESGEQPLVRILIDGPPGSGKTTVAARLAELLRERGRPVQGFVTHELRERGVRVGFEVETLDGRRTVLAHVDLPGPPRVGKYGVDLEAFERVALPALEEPPSGTVVVLDELGKMELASDAFRSVISQLFETSLEIVATVQVVRHPFTDALKRRPDAERVRVTRANRGELPELLAHKLLRSA